MLCGCFGFLALKNAFGYLLYLRTRIKKHKNPPLCTSSPLTRLTTILNGFLSYSKKYCAKKLATSLVRWELFSDLMTFREHLGFLYYFIFWWQENQQTPHWSTLLEFEPRTLLLRGSSVFHWATATFCCVYTVYMNDLVAWGRYIDEEIFLKLLSLDRD